MKGNTMFFRTQRLNGLLAVLLTGGLIFTTGCGEDTSDGDAGADTRAGSSDNVSVQSILLTEAPEGAQSIAELKQSAKEGDEVVVQVVVGGSVHPFVDGRASVQVVDAGLQSKCLEESDPCPTPWDYCCQIDERNANGATIQIVDADGRVIEADLTKSFATLSTLTVVGVVGPRPNNEVLTINATGIYVAPQVQ